MSADAVCPVCQNAESSSCQRFPIPNVDGSEFRCDVCGWYAASGSDEIIRLSDLMPIQRALLSHWLLIQDAKKGSRNPLGYRLQNGSLDHLIVDQ